MSLPRMLPSSPEKARARHRSYLHFLQCGPHHTFETRAPGICLGEFGRLEVAQHAVLSFRVSALEAREKKSASHSWQRTNDHGSAVVNSHILTLTTLVVSTRSRQCD